MQRPTLIPDFRPRGQGRPGTRQRWQGPLEPAGRPPWVQPGSLAAGPAVPRRAAPPPAPSADPIALALAAGARQGRHEGHLGLLLALGMILLLVQGWLLPLLAAAFAAAPVVGLALALLDRTAE